VVEHPLATPSEAKSRPECQQKSTFGNLDGPGLGRAQAAENTTGTFSPVGLEDAIRGRWSPPHPPGSRGEAHMIDHPDIHLRWVNSAEKRRWMRSLAMLLQVMEDSAILKTDREREGYKLVRTRLKQEFEYERLTWPLDE